MNKKPIVVLMLLLAFALMGLVACDTQPQKYTVTFRGDNVSISPLQVEDGAIAEKPEDPARDGYVFKGWFDETLTEEYLFDEPVVSDLTLYAKWAELVKVSFNGIEPSEEVEIEKGTALSEPEDPEKEGYRFVQWVDAEGDPFDFTAAIEGDITLTAQWQRVFKVTFDTSPSKIRVPVQFVDEGNCAVAPQDEIYRDDQYDFGGWVTEDGEIFDFDQVLTSDITLKVQWNKYFVVDYKWADGYGTPAASRKVYEGGKAENLRLLDQVEYATRAVYWYEGNVANPDYLNPGELGARFDFDTVITENTTLYTYFQERTSWIFPEEATYDAENPFTVETAGQAFDGSLTYGEDYLEFNVNENSDADHVTQLQPNQMLLPYSSDDMGYFRLKYKNLGSDTVLRVLVFGYAADDTEKANLTNIGGINCEGLQANMSETDDWAEFYFTTPVADGCTIVFIRFEFISNAADAFDNNGTHIRIAEMGFTDCDPTKNAG